MAVVPTWSLFLAELNDGSASNGRKLAELTHVRDRKVSFKLNQPQTIEFTADLAHPAMPKLLDTATGSPHAYIMAYRNGALAMAPAETGAIEVVGQGSSKSVRVTAVEAPWIRLQKRLVGQSINGVSWTATDRGQIVLQAIFIVDSEQPTKIAGGSVAATSTTNAGPFYYKPVLELIQELAAPTNGFDFWFTPLDPATDAEQRIALINVAPLRGTTKPSVVFEYGYGTRANVREYNWKIDIAGRGTRFVSLPPSYPNNIQPAVANIPDASIETVIGRREELVQTDVVDYTLRQALVDEHHTVRKHPRNIFTFQPHLNDGTGRVPTFLTDYGIGDIFEGRVVDEDILLLDGYVRLYGADVEIGDDGSENLSLTLVEEP